MRQLVGKLAGAGLEGFHPGIGRQAAQEVAGGTARGPGAFCLAGPFEQGGKFEVGRDVIGRQVKGPVELCFGFPVVAAQLGELGEEEMRGGLQGIGVERFFAGVLGSLVVAAVGQGLCPFQG